MQTHYIGSRGAVEIATMAYPHAANALAKLQREAPERSAEIEALGAHIAALEASRPAEGEPNPRAAIGGNFPPEETHVEPLTTKEAKTAFDAVKAHMEDLLLEARNWADGATVQTQAQADEIGRLLEELRLACDAADTARVEEKRPLDEQIAEIQARYNVYIAPLKNKAPGKLPLAMEALKAALKPYLDKREADRRAEAERLRQEQEAATKRAAEAARAAAPGDLAAREEAEDLISAAAGLEAEAKRVEQAKPQALGGSRALGLKKTYTPMLSDPGAALRHYAKERPDELKGFLLDLAKIDVREGKRSIPGFDIVEGTRL